jgi:hypothetical protein
MWVLVVNANGHEWADLLALCQQFQQLMSTGRCPDLPPFRLPLFLDRDHFRRGPKLGCPVPQVDYHALISERKNR